MKVLVGIIGLVLLCLACGKEGNIADCEDGQKEIPCSERTPDENARLALKNKDYDTAIELLEGLIDEEPDGYARYVLVGAAYAAKSGVDIITVASANFVSGGGSVIGQMNAVVPDPSDYGTDEAFATAVTQMNTAVTWIESVPEDLRSATSDEDYASSATLQLLLYQSAYSVMYLNQFAVSAETGEFDIAKLETMTEDDAIEILNNLSSAAAIQGGEDGEQLQGKIDEALSAIDDQDGAGNKEKLVEFLKAEEGLGN